MTLNLTTPGSKIKTAPITGYAVFADGKRVTDVDSPSSRLPGAYLAAKSVLISVHTDVYLHCSSGGGGGCGGGGCLGSVSRQLPCKTYRVFF